MLKILWRSNFDMLKPPALNDYICSPDGYVDTDYILRDNVSLFFIEDHTAVFAECDEGVQIWRSQYGAFIKEATLRHAKKLLVMPVSMMIEFADKLGPPKTNLCFMFKTTRCGSTLLTQMLELSGKCVAMSEPTAMNDLSQLYKAKPDDVKTEQFARSIISILCKPVSRPSENALYLVKVTSTSVALMPLLYKLYPDAKFLFMYRNVVNVSTSVYRSIQVNPLVLIMFYASFFTTKVLEEFMNEMGMSGYEYSAKSRSLLDMGTFAWCVSITQYQQCKEAYPDLRCVTYEDLMADPGRMMKVILRFLDVPEELAERTLAALNEYSQSNSILAGSKSVRGPSLTPERERCVNDVLVRFGLSKVGEDFKLNGMLN